MNRTLIVGAVVCAAIFLFVMGGGGRTPSLDVVARPDPKKPGHLGIGVYLKKGSKRIVAEKGSPLQAEVTIKTSGGKVIHQATDDIRKFAFG